MPPESNARELFQIWVYLSQEPLLWLAITCAVYAISDRISIKAKRHPLANSVLLTTAILSVLLIATGTSFEVYFEGAQFVHFLLGPATVALAIPLIRNWQKVKEAFWPMLLALIAGSSTAVITALTSAYLLGASPEVLKSLAPKSVTSPIAMGIAEILGGIPALTAVLVITTGILGAIIVTPLLNILNIKDVRARGFAAGVGAHGIGTARAFQINSLAGTFAGIGMAINGALTAFMVPLIFWLLM
jgi:predicted murein hydrolase (TIGR00659 family)